jgi:hypothetical protein
MTPKRLRELGEAMFGSSWKSDVARALGRTDRLVRFWASGTRGIGVEDAKRIEGLARERLEELKRRIEGMAM